MIAPHILEDSGLELDLGLPDFLSSASKVTTSVSVIAHLVLTPQDDHLSVGLVLLDFPLGDPLVFFPFLLLAEGLDDLVLVRAERVLRKDVSAGERCLLAKADLVRADDARERCRAGDRRGEIRTPGRLDGLD